LVYSSSTLRRKIGFKKGCICQKSKDISVKRRNDLRWNVNEAVFWCLAATILEIPHIHSTMNASRHLAKEFENFVLPISRGNRHLPESKITKTPK